MRLTVLGSSGGYPGPDNPNSGFLLEHGPAKIWLDAGTGTFAALQRITEYRSVDALVLSHVHPDHCADIYPLFVALRYSMDGPSRIPLYAPPGTRDVLAALLLEDGWGKLGEGFDVHVIREGDDLEIAGVHMTFARMDHPAYTLAIRAKTAAGTVTYSADTGPQADLATFAAGSDLFVCEATYQEGKVGPPVHLTARQAAETALRAGVRELALTHVWPPFDPQVSVVEALAVAETLPISWAQPGKVFEIG